MSDKSQKTEKPTQRRLQEARREGRFPTSKEFVGAFQFLAAVMMIAGWGDSWLDGVRLATRQMMERAFKPDFSQADVWWLGYMAMAHVLGPVIVGGGVLAMVTLGLQFAVTQFGFSMHRLAPEWNRLNPLNKLKDLTKHTPASAVQAVVLLVLCGLALYYIAHRNAEALFLLPLVPVETGYRQVFAAAGDLLWKSAGVFVAFGCYDYVRQRFRFQSQMKMSKQEIRDEMRHIEGDPTIKARIRRLRRSMLRRKMMKQVPEATAVVVNPTHYAVVLKYEIDTPSAPLVVAKGKNYLALRIRELATRHDVPLVENPPLARALYDAVPVGGEIPVHLYKAVAEILAYVYRTMSVRG